MSSTASAASSACRRSNVAGAPHGLSRAALCRDTKLFLPVENIELLSALRLDHPHVDLDRLGGSGWQARRPKLKNRIREIAGELDQDRPPSGICMKRRRCRCSRMPMTSSARASPMRDRRPTRRHQCHAKIRKPGRWSRSERGDVGFARRQVALRAAFAAPRRKQVAVVVPRPCWRRGHQRHIARFRGFRRQCRAASRLDPETSN